MGIDREHAVRSRSVGKIASALFLCCVFIFLFRALPTLRSYADSESYIAFADQIVSGEIFEIRNRESLRAARTMRTPGFPVMIALVKVLPLDFTLGLTGMFALLAMIGIVGVFLVFDGVLLSFASGCAVVGGFWTFRRYYSFIFTEWPALSFLVFLLLALVWYFRSPSTPRLVVVGLLCSCVALIRPAMIVTLPVPIALGMLGEKKGRLLLGSMVSLAPVLLWMAFNWFSIGVFGLAAFGGTNIFGIATSISSAEVREGDSQTLRRFIRRVNAKKRPAVGRESECVDAELPREHRCLLRNYTYAYNIWTASRSVARSAKIDPVEWNELMLEYTKRALLADPEAYLSWIWCQLYLSFTYWTSDIVLVILAGFGCLCAVGAISGRNTLPAGKAVAVMFVVHALHLLLVSTVETMLTRYHDLTFIACLVGCAWSMCERIAAAPPELRLCRRSPEPER